MHIESSEISIEELDPDHIIDIPMLPLSEFLECFTPPQTGRIVDGFPQGFDAYEAFDIPRQCALTFHRKVNPNVPLSFEDSSWGGASAGHWLKVTLPIEFNGRFKLLPYDPESGDIHEDHIYHTVEDLVKAFPVFVQANSSYGDNIEQPNCSFSCGDRLKLIRLIYKENIKYLECRSLTEPQLLLLPLECVGDFTVLPDNNSYTLSDIMGMVSRRRRVKLATEASKQPIKLPGLPNNYKGELFLEEPDTFIEASPVSDRGLIIGLPSDLDMMIIPDTMEQGQLFSSFITANKNQLPVIVRVVDWTQETTILENHYVKPGVEIVVHGWTKQSKVIALCDNEYFAIPLTYTGLFRIKPKRFQGVTELERAYPGNKLRVVQVDHDDVTFPLKEGDIIRIKREDTLKRKSFREVEIKCERYDENGRSREIKLPLGSNAVFEEVLDDGKSDDYTIKELVSFVTDQELVVEVVKRSTDQKVKGRDLLVGSSVLLCDYVIEPAVYVSVESADAPAFHIPLRTTLYVSLLYQLDKSASPLLTKSNPRLSTLDRCAEVLSFDVFTSLRPQRALQTVQSFGRAAAQNPVITMNTWASGGRTSVTNGWHGALTASNDYNLLSGNARKPPSIAESDMAVTKQKGLSKLKSKFRRHKSQENLFRSGSPSNLSTDLAPLSIARQEVEYTRSGINENIILAGRSVQVQNGQLHVTSVKDMHGKGSIGSESSAGEGSASLSSASTPQSPALPPSQPISNKTQPLKVNVALNKPPRQRVTGTQQRVVSGERQVTNGQREVTDLGENGLDGVNGLHPQPSINSSSSDGASSIPSPQSPQSATSLQVPPGFALVPSHPQADDSGTSSFGSLSQLPQGSPGYMLVPVISPQMLDGLNTLYRNHSVSSVGGDDEEDDYDSGVQDRSFKKTKFKLTIPPDGNLYHFSVKKMAEFLRQMRLEDKHIELCVKQKVDGKKFSRLSHDDLNKLGILHPIVVHFRRLTSKNKTKFML